MTLDSMSHDTRFEQLRSKRLSEATRPFLARGNKIKRCPRCQLSHCICTHRKTVAVDFDIVLLMHRNEVLKPTNTGRLIADCFPDNTFAFVWSRTDIDDQLQALLDDSERSWLLVFPGEKNPQHKIDNSSQETPQNTLQETPQPTAAKKKTTLLIIDGTWKQARKIYGQSPWLHQFPALSLTPSTTSQYNMRKAPEKFQTSTAEAFIDTLEYLGKSAPSQLLHEYFQVFNHHYHASRLNMTPEQLAQKITDNPSE